MSKKLDHGGDDEKGEIDRGKSAIEEDSNTTVVDPSATTIHDDDGEEMAFEAEKFDWYRSAWESNWGKTCGLFQELTVLSSMQFTHYTPGHTPYRQAGSTPETLQIFSIKLTRIDGGLALPLSVYGVVAARDIVDRNRNILFSRGRSEAQEFTKHDPFLHLIGPSRAVVSTKRVSFEIQLKVRGAEDSQDKALISQARSYSRGGYDPGVSSMCFKNVLCTLELNTIPVGRTVQATILGVEVVKDEGSWPFKYGGLVACSPLSGKVVVTDSDITRNINTSSSIQIVLLDSKDEAIPRGDSGYVPLWRQVVSVDFEGGLEIVVQTYSKSRAIAAATRVCFTPKVCNISQKKCALGDADVTITVAWSRVATSKTDVALENCGRGCV